MTKQLITLKHDTFSVKGFLRARLKENMTDLTHIIFSAANSRGTVTPQIFPELTDYHVDYFIEYHEVLKLNCGVSSSPLNFKRRISSIYVTYQQNFFKITYGITSRTAIRIEKVDAHVIRSHEKIHDIEALSYAVQAM